MSISDILPLVKFFLSSFNYFLSFDLKWRPKMAERVVATVKKSESEQKCSNSCKQNPGFNSSGPTADRILQFQRTAGNQAVQRVIKSRALQAKIKIGQLNDKCEQEADRVAEQVMKMPDPVFQRRCAKCNGDEKKILQAKESPRQIKVTQNQDVPPIVHEVLRSSGAPLDAETRAFMEPRFGQDFSWVRVHKDEKAAESARAVNSLAYSVGYNVVFDTGQHTLGSVSGQRLLAHELTHVIQQASASDQQSIILRSCDDISKKQTNKLSVGTPVKSVTQTATTTLMRKVKRESHDPDREWQVACVKRLGGCSNTRSGGIPTSEEIAQYNQECRKQTGYSDDVTPTSDECLRTQKELEPAKVSFELADAPISSSAHTRVKKWLAANKSDIIASETFFMVDRRAIAGAIAWEAMENILPISARAVGPGKVHYSTSRLPFVEGDPVAKQIEQAGYMPKQSMSKRKEILATPQGAIKYIAAIMKAEADEAVKAGYHLNCNPPMLTTFYNAWDFPGVKSLFATKKAPSPLVPNDKMGGWVDKNINFLEDAVGKPDASMCSQTRTLINTSSALLKNEYKVTGDMKQQKGENIGGLDKEEEKRSSIINTVLGLMEEHYLMGAAGQVPGKGGGANSRGVLMNPENHSASIDVDYGKNKGIKSHVCGGRYSKVQSLPEGDPSNETHQSSPQKYKWKRTSDGDEVSGEACEGKRHFDCGGFVTFCYRAACPQVKYPGGVDVLPNSSEWREVQKDKVQKGDIAYRSGHVGVCISDSKVISALGKKWGIHQESVGTYNRFGYLACIKDAAEK
jgi:hypothetical protein